jgi:hypothetical protein
VKSTVDIMREIIASPMVCLFVYPFLVFIVRLRESYQGIVYPWIRFANPWIHIPWWT